MAPAVAANDFVKRGWGLRKRLLLGKNFGGLVGIVGSHTAEKADSFDVGVVEVPLEVGDGVFGSGVFVPVAEVVQEDAGVF